jgi:hexosaminidase
MKDGHDLQSYFSKRVNQIIISKKKKVIGWDEILEGGAPAGAAVMSWQGVKGGIEASKQKLPVVMSPAPMYYLDMMQGDPAVEARVYSTARLKDVYNFDILPAGIDSTYVLGGQGNLWTEQIRIEPQVEYMIYPRAFAIAETLWSPKSKKNYDNFVARVENQFARSNVAEVNYAPSLYDPIMSVKKNSDGKMVIELTAEAPNIDFYYTFDNTIPNSYYDKYKGPIVLPDGTDMIRITSYRGRNQMGRLISLSAEDLAKRVRK